MSRVVRQSKGDFRVGRRSDAPVRSRRQVHGRSVRRELDLEGVDIAAEMVAGGVARDCPRYSGGRYSEAEGRSGRRDDQANVPATGLLPRAVG
jgi:hypothetical protein